MPPKCSVADRNLQHNFCNRDLAICYAWAGVYVFPCIPRGPKRKQPLTKNGCHDATRDEQQITAWWTRRPDALIGMRTGRISRVVVLDVDVKDRTKYGFDTLAELGAAILPDTVLVHTGSGGLHIWFDPQEREIHNTQGARGRGIGPGLDWRGEGGLAILPSPGSGYWFDPHYPFGSIALAPIPTALLPREPKRLESAQPVKPVTGLSPYASAALDSACRRIVAATNGEQEATLNGEAFAIGTLAGAGAMPEAFARRTLIWATTKVPNYNPRRPWRPAELVQKIERAFDAGRAHPREARHAG